VTGLIEENRYVRGVITDIGEKFFSKVVIDAGRVNSVVGRKAGLIPKRKGTNMILYTTLGVELGEDVINERFGDCIEYYLAPGTQYKTWPWIFPKRDIVTVGTGGYMDKNLITDKFPTVNKYMENFLNLPIVKKKLEGGKIISWGLHLEFDEEIENRVKNGLILTGEAGGFVIPFLGEGMVEAFFTGIYAVLAAAEAINAGDFSEGKLSGKYRELIDENFFMQTFHHIAAVNKEAIPGKSDEEITKMMQSVILGGGFISNAIHTKWVKGAEEAQAYSLFTVRTREAGMADMNEVMKVLEEQRGKYSDKRVARHFKGWNKTLQYYFTDIDEYFVIELICGEPQPVEKKKLENSDIMYSMDTDTFLKLNRGEISGFKAYQQKKLKIKAAMAEIMKLKKLDKV